MIIDLKCEAEKVRAQSVELAHEGWLSDSAAPAQVAAYVAASDHVDSLGIHELVQIVRQGLDVDVAGRNSSALCGLARDVLLSRLLGPVALSGQADPDV